MIDWIYEPEHAHHVGFYNGAFFYRVYMTAEGWNWEFIPEWDVTWEGYGTALEAMKQAELHLQRLEDWQKYAMLSELDVELDLTEEEREEIYWDIIAHERMEQRKGIGN